jgi:hypothetical protein
MTGRASAPPPLPSITIRLCTRAEATIDAEWFSTSGLRVIGNHIVSGKLQAHRP